MTIRFVNDWQSYKAGMTRSLSPGQEALALGDRAAVPVVDAPPAMQDVRFNPATKGIETEDGQPISVDGGATTAVAASRAALAADSGATLELANGVTYTLTDAVALPSGVTLMGPASGTATMAVTGTATINGGTTPISITAGQVYAAIPRAASPAAFVVKGS